jgi:hypothetical protein
MHAIKLRGYSLDNAAHAGIRYLNLAEIADLSVLAGFSNRDRILQLGDTAGPTATCAIGV